MIKYSRLPYQPFAHLFFVFLLAISNEGYANPRDWLAAIDAKIFGQAAEEQSFHKGVTLYKANKMDEALAAFQAAAQSGDRLLKAKALHNAGLIQIEKKQAEPALKSLRDAAAYDNASVEIKENLSWLLAHIKEEEEKKKQEQNKDPSQTSEDQKTAEQKEDESKEQKSQPANEKPGEEQKKDQEGEQKSAEKNEPGKDGKKGDEKKVAEESKDGSTKGSEAEKKQAAEKAQEKDQNQGGEKDKDKGKPAMASKDAPSESEKTNPSKGQMILTPAEIKQQEAERLLRTIDDRIGRYPLTDTEATSKRGNDGKNW
ncbi:MAG: hypothetical protein V4655_01255 [Bdellovibrionota bacterium]